MIDPALLRNLLLDDKGIWKSAKISNVSYPEDDYQVLFSLEDNSFWFEHRNNCILTIIRRFPPKEYIIDAGGGNGFVSLGIQNAGFEVILLEPSQKAILNAQRRGIRRILNTTFQDAVFSEDSVDSIGLFDVLEHIQHDQAFLTMVNSSMKKEGHLYITVPAHQYLWSWTDIRAGHFRRYSISSLTRILHESGFQVQYASYFFLGLSLPIFISRTLPALLRLPEYRFHKKGVNAHRKKRGLLGKILDHHWKHEVQKLKLSKVCHGASIIAVAEPDKQ